MREMWESAVMLKFIGGIVAGAALAFGYVRFDINLPAFLRLPDTFRGNLISTATEAELYDLGKDLGTRRRALEIYFANRASDAAQLDARSGHPFLQALYRARATREAGLLRGQWSFAFDKALSKVALRARLERKYASTDTIKLKQHMLRDALNRKPFLKQWFSKNGITITDETLLVILKKTSARVLREPEPD